MYFQSIDPGSLKINSVCSLHPYPYPVQPAFLCKMTQLFPLFWDSQTGVDSHRTSRDFCKWRGSKTVQRSPDIPAASLQIEKPVHVWLSTWVSQAVLFATWSPQTPVGKTAWQASGQSHSQCFIPIPASVSSAAWSSSASSFGDRKVPFAEFWQNPGFQRDRTWPGSSRSHYLSVSHWCRRELPSQTAGTIAFDR